MSVSQSLWAQTFECIAMVGEASGKGKFHADAIEMLSLVGDTSSSSNLRGGSSGSSSIGQHGLEGLMDPEAKKIFLKTWVRIA